MLPSRRGETGPGAVVFLPAGRYRTATGAVKSLVVQSADHLTVEGTAGTTIVSSDLDSAVFSIHDSKSVTVRRLSIDHDPLGYTQGTITRVDVAHMTCDVAIDPGYPAPTDPQIKGGALHPFVFPKQGYYQLDRYWPQPTQMEKTGDHTWHWTLTGPPNIDNWVGKRFIIEGNCRSHAFEISNLTDGTFEDIHYWGGGANAGFYIGGLDGDDDVPALRDRRPPGSGRLYSCGGGGQISGQRGKLVFDDCDFSKIDDDGIDILATWTRIIAQKDARTLIVQQRQDNYLAGDHVEIWDWLHKKARSAAIITASTRNPDGTFTLGLDRDVVTERVGAGVGQAFGIAAMTDGLDRLIDVSNVGQETLIRNCKFQVFRAKCLNLKAANCTVEGCAFRDSFQPAISAAPEWYFEEGPPIRNLVVRDCTFVDCNHFNIDIGAAPSTGVPGAKPDPNEATENISHDSTNILIEDNSFTGYGTVPSVFGWSWPVGGAIHVTNAAHVMIRAQQFRPPRRYGAAGDAEGIDGELQRRADDEQSGASAMNPCNVFFSRFSCCSLSARQRWRRRRCPRCRSRRHPPRRRASPGTRTPGSACSSTGACIPSRRANGRARRTTANGSCTPRRCRRRSTRTSRTSSTRSTSTRTPGCAPPKTPGCATSS